MLKQLREEVYKAYISLTTQKLCTQKWGNVSGLDRKQGLMVITPSGVLPEALCPKDLSILSLKTGGVVEGNLRPSSDVLTHLILYRAFKNIKSIVHTHSLYATAWAQACKSIPILGTTHADYWYGDIPCTRKLTTKEINMDYEAHTGNVIVETFKKRDSDRYPGVLVAQHGPFTWGKNSAEALYHASVLESIAKLASETLRINPAIKSIRPALLNIHYGRKHGPNSYYGQ